MDVDVLAVSSFVLIQLEFLFREKKGTKYEALNKNIVSPKQKNNTGAREEEGKRKEPARNTEKGRSAPIANYTYHPAHPLQPRRGYSPAPIRTSNP